MIMRQPNTKLKASNRDKFVDPGIGLRILNPDGELVKIIGEPKEVTAERKRMLAAQRRGKQ